MSGRRAMAYPENTKHLQRPRAVSRDGRSRKAAANVRFPQSGWLQDRDFVTSMLQNTGDFSRTDIFSWPDF
jgi:hypothetical protein